MIDRSEIKVYRKLQSIGLYHHHPYGLGMWREELLDLLAHAKENVGENFLEIGSWNGFSSVALCLIQSLVPDESKKVFSVDASFSPFYDLHLKRSRVTNNVKCEVSSFDLDLRDKGLFSFAFIDGYHSYSAIINDFYKVLPYLTEKCTICFHDVSPMLFDPSYLDKMKEVVEHTQRWESSTYEDFRLDEAIGRILVENPEFYPDNKNKTDCEYINRTGRPQWIRGMTSSYNSLFAISRGQNED